MLNQEELAIFFKEYTDKNLETLKQKFTLFEEIRAKELDLKEYSIALGDFNKQQNKVGLGTFEFMLQRSIQYLSNFDPSDINKNTDNVLNFINILEVKEREFSAIVEDINSLKYSWDSFMSTNKEFEGSLIENSVKDKFEEINKTLSNMNLDTIGEVESVIQETKKNIEIIKLKVDMLKTSLTQDVFVEKEALNLRQEITDLIDNEEDINLFTFSEKATELMHRVNEIKANSSMLGTGPVKVIKVSTKEDSDIYKYTLKFGDFLIKNDPFFNNEESLNWDETGEYVYYENIPIKGIFSGKEICLTIDYSTDYIHSVSSIDDSAKTIFNFLAWTNIIIGAVSMFIGGLIGPLLFISFIMGTWLFFNIYLKSTKRAFEIRTKMKKMFVFSKIDYVIASIGDNCDLVQMNEGIFLNFDDIIGNQKYLDWGGDKWLQEYPSTNSQSEMS